jgi:hypothetical protein
MVTETFVGNLDGAEVEYHKGEIVEADDPALKKWPGHFGPVVFVHRNRAERVEQATAAPGEKR